MPGSKYFTTIFTYPWDLSDDGLERALDVIQGEAGLGGVSLAVAYHIGTFFLPHNPKRKIFFGEDGMLLFVPEPKRWTGVRLRPRVGQAVENPEWLHRLVEGIKKRRQAKRAIIAVARRLLAVLVSMLKSGETYHATLAELKERRTRLERRRRRRTVAALQEAAAV